jgi:MFS family permease
MNNASTYRFVVAMFVIARIILGFGIPFAIVAASSLIGELSYPKERAVLTSLFNSSWFIGAIVAAGVNYGTFQMTNTWSWRIPSLLQCIPSFLQLGSIWYVESRLPFSLSKDIR